MKKLFFIIFIFIISCYESDFNYSEYPTIPVNLQIILIEDNDKIIFERNIDTNFIIIDNNNYLSDNIIISEQKDFNSTYSLKFILTFENTYNSILYYKIENNNIFPDYNESGYIPFNNNIITIEFNNFKYNYNNSYHYNFSF